LATTPPTGLPTKAGSDPRDDAFIREVDEAYRQDTMQSFARRYGRWILLGIGAALAALGGFLFWQADAKRRLEAVSEQFSQALEKADSGATTEAAAAFATMGKSDNPSYRALALLAEGGIAITGGDAKKAAGLMRGVADDAQVAAPLRDAARLKLVRLEFDTQPPEVTLKALQPYLEGDNPWFPVAGEMAALAHMKAGAPDKAGPIFYRIAGDERAPASLRARASQMAAMLGQDVTKLAEEAEKKAAAEAAAAAGANETAAPAGANGAAAPAAKS